MYLNFFISCVMIKTKSLVILVAMAMVDGHAETLLQILFKLLAA